MQFFQPIEVFGRVLYAPSAYNIAHIRAMYLTFYLTAVRQQQQQQQQHLHEK